MCWMDQIKWMRYARWVFLKLTHNCKRYRKVGWWCFEGILSTLSSAAIIIDSINFERSNYNMVDVCRFVEQITIIGIFPFCRRCVFSRRGSILNYWAYSVILCHPRDSHIIIIPWKRNMNLQNKGETINVFSIPANTVFYIDQIIPVEDPMRTLCREELIMLIEEEAAHKIQMHRI